MLLFVIKFLQSSGFDGLWFYRTQILQTVWYIRSQISCNIYNNETSQVPAMLTGQSNSPTEKIKRLHNENVYNCQNCKMFPLKHIFFALIICYLMSRSQYKHMGCKTTLGGCQLASLTWNPQGLMIMIRFWLRKL